MTETLASAGKREPTIVGVGASAGGLSALKQLLGGVPPDSGLAFVIVVHLSPEHESYLPDLLRSHVPIPVTQITATTQIEPNHAYVIPPNANLEAVDTHLRLSELETRRAERAPIDHFFRTLAATHDGHSVGIVLTGTGSDGTLGLREIKERSGLTIAQDPAEAEYDGMPRSAIASGAVDLVLPLAEIVPSVLRIGRTEPQVPTAIDDETPDEDELRFLHRVTAQVRVRTGRDFGRYKPSMALRRIARRMQLSYVEEPERYLTMLRKDPEESRALSDDLLINVTSFFRDPGVFELLADEVLPRLFDQKEEQGDEAIRVWSVGCATGEEAYSLAMLLTEEAERRTSPPRIQMFASDLHRESLEKAREGFYPGDIEIDVPRERMTRFFEPVEGGFRVKKQLREQVVFSPHDLLRDPPFSKIDMISCRNLLIYLQRDVQREVLRLFHYALWPDGYLLLGSSETVESGELFRVQEKRASLYRKRNVPPEESRLPVFLLDADRARGVGTDGRTRAASEPTGYGQLHQEIVEEVAPPSVLVSPDDRVAHLSAHVGRYLVHPGGEPTANVFDLVRDELRLELRSALHAARRRGAPVRSRQVTVEFDGEKRPVSVDVRPALGREREGFALVVFDERAVERPEAGQAAASELDGELVRHTEERLGHADSQLREVVERLRLMERQGDDAAVEELELAPVIESLRSAAAEASALRDAFGSAVSERADELEKELLETRERLQTVLEEYESSREEMRSANEELQSSNEELRSTLEELETSKEELQSINEELQTVNQENRHKVDELAQLSSDLHNLLSATDIATLFLDRDLRILRFTPQVGELFRVRLVDRGRPIADLSHRLGYDGLVDDAERVLAHLTPIEREIQDDDGRWYLTRLIPYRSEDDRIAGVVVTFVDITQRMRWEQEIEEAKEYAEGIVETLHEPLLVLDSDLRVRSANEAFFGKFLARRETTVGREVYELGNGQWDIPELRTLLEEVLATDGAFDDYVVRHEFEELGERVMLLNGRRLPQIDTILLGIRDVTEDTRAREELRRSEERYRTLFESIDEGFCIVEPILDADGTGTDHRFVSTNPAFVRHTGLRDAEGRTALELVPELECTWFERYGRIVMTGERERFVEHSPALGQWFDVDAFPVGGPDSGQVGLLFTDVTDRKKSEEALVQAVRAAEEASEVRGHLLAVMSHELRTPLMSVSLFAQALREGGRGPVTEEQCGVLGRIVDNSRHMIEIIDEALVSSRLENGSVEMRLEQTDLGEVAESALSLVEEQALSRGLRLELARGDRPIEIRTDERKVRQILINLLANAIKHTDGGAVTVRLEQSASEVLVRVVDTGEGISPDDQGRIFEPFTRAEGAARKSDSAGLGLTISLQMAKLLGGDLTVASTPGEGSTFTLRLPLRRGPVAV